MMHFCHQATVSGQPSFHERAMGGVVDIPHAVRWVTKSKSKLRRADGSRRGMRLRRHSYNSFLSLSPKLSKVKLPPGRYKIKVYVSCLHCIVAHYFLLLGQ